MSEQITGRGFFGRKKGEKITLLTEIRIGDILLKYSPQFNAENTYLVTDRRQYGETVRFDLIYYNPITKERIGAEDMSMTDYDLTNEEYYFPAEKMFSGNGYFTDDKTKYVNLEVSKSSPNRTGEVIRIETYPNNNPPLSFAVVKFRDFSENIGIN